MLYLNKQDLIRSITPQEMMDAIEKAYGLFTAGNYFMPDRPTVEYQNKTIVYMPCFADGAMGQKILTVFPENTQRGLPAIDGLMLLCDYDTGIPQVMMDGKALTALRTGGVGGVAVRHLSQADACTLAIIGAGVQGANQAAFACAARPIGHIYVYDSYAKDPAPFIHRLEEVLGEDHPPVTFCSSPEEAARQSQILITATTSNEPVFPDDSTLFAGKCCIGVGSYKPTMREYPPCLWSLLSQVYVDLPFACEESGDLSQPLQEGLLTMEKVYTMGQLLAGQAPRPKEEETAFFKTVGMALFDLIAAQAIAQKAMEKGIGQKIEL